MEVAWASRGDHLELTWFNRKKLSVPMVMMPARFKTTRLTAMRRTMLLTTTYHAIRDDLMNEERVSRFLKSSRMPCSRNR